MKKEENYFGIHPNTFEMLFKDKKDLLKEELGTEENEKIINTLNVFTKLNHRNIFIYFLKKYFSHKYNIDLEKIKYNEEIKQYEYVLDNEVITFNMISNIVNDKELQKELKSEKRFGKCHERSFGQAHNIDNAKIVTGIIKTIDGKFLHTVIEFPGKKEPITTYIMDWTQNIYMKKDDYIKLMEFYELSSFDAQEVFYDMELMNKMNVSDISMKPYLAFRDEFIKDLEKNMHLLSEEDKEKINNVKK